MINKILNLDFFPSEFDIEVQKKKYLNFHNSLPDFFLNKSLLSKNEIVKLIREGKSSKKTELLAILFWGVYFSVINRNDTIMSLLNFINKTDFEEIMEDKISLIVDSNSPSNLFLLFQNEHKIPGLGYAYFTKLFFFYRLAYNKEPYLILDKWLCRAWCAIDGSINNNTMVFDTYFRTNIDFHFHGELRRKKHIAYGNYISFMKKISEINNINIIDLEEKLFGADKRLNPIKNPRFFYLKWAEKNNIPQNKIKDIIAIALDKSTLDVFYINKTNQYMGLYTDYNYKKKEGYIDNNGWLNVSENLKDRLINISDWLKGNTKGGSREKFKVKFVTQKAALDFLINQNFELK